MHKLRIAVWHNLPSGGGKRQLYYHVKGLLSRGHYVESWCPDTAEQKFLPLGELIRENIIPLKKSSPLYHHPLKTVGVTREMLDSIEDHCRRCGEEIARGQFDILFANGCMFLRTTPIARYVDMPSAMYLNEPFRWFYEAMPELPWVAPPEALNERLSRFKSWRRRRKKALFDGAGLQARAELEYAKAFDLILVNSVYSRESVLRAYNLESKVCYLGIDTDLYQPTGEPKEDFVVGLGTIYHGKGVDRAIRAVGAMERDNRPTLVWIGNGAPKAELAGYEALAKKLRVRFVPHIHITDAAVISLLSRAKAMIYTSRLEPFGLAPLEANACETAAVAIAEGGVRETIRDGINGFLAPADDPAILARLLSRLVNDPVLSAEMGRRAREHVATSWSLEQCTDNIESFLGSLASGAESHRARIDPKDVAAIAPTNDIRLGVDSVRVKRNNIQIRGWAFIDDGLDADDARVFVVVRTNAGCELVSTIQVRRTDVTEHFGNEVNYDNAGFAVGHLTALRGPYEVGILIRRAGRIAFALLQ